VLNRHAAIAATRRAVWPGHCSLPALLFIVSHWLRLDLGVSLAGVDCHKEGMLEAFWSRQFEWAGPRVAKPDRRIPGELVGAIGHHEVDAAMVPAAITSASGGRYNGEPVKEPRLRRAYRG
jgi:hypothetical protein